MQRVFFALHYFFAPARHGRRAYNEPDADGLTQYSPRHSAPPSVSTSDGIGQGREAAKRTLALCWRMCYPEKWQGAWADGTTNGGSRSRKI